MRAFAFVILMLVAILAFVVSLGTMLIGKSAIHEILSAVQGLTAVIAFAAAVIIRSLPDPPK